ncbi:MAG: DUF6448 family protein [Pseudomonadota bacterium]
MIGRTLKLKTMGVGLAAMLGVSVLGASNASAHCDGLDGPVVGAARTALETGDVNRVLIWVAPGDEAEVRQAFEQTRKVRALDPEARALADRYFFETLVRIHRAGEGVAYTGLKPAGRDLGPAIPAADKAVETGDAGAVERLLTGTMKEGLEHRLHTVSQTKAYDPADVAAGREHVKSYVGFVHYVEGIYQAASAMPHGDGHATE